MQQLFLAAMVAASLVAVFAVSQVTSASGRCYWWWRQNGVTHYLYYDCAHPIRPPWEGGAGASPGAAAGAVAVPQGGHIYANTYSFGQCTWWAAQTRRDENLGHLGNAGMWAINARLRGLRVGSTPRVGATAVFGPRVQGTSWLGHVAHVVRVPGARFEVPEMNYYGDTPRGGWGRVDYRWANTGGGVNCIEILRGGYPLAFQAGKEPRPPFDFRFWSDEREYTLSAWALLVGLARYQR